METNEELYYSFIDGNQNSFAKLMEKFGDPLTFYIYGYTKDFGDAEDLMIDVFAYLIAKKPKIHENGLRAYLYKSARNMAIRNISKKNKYFYIELDEVSYLTDEKTMVNNLLDNKEKDRILHLCMQELSNDYREAIYLVYFEGMTHKQAALIMGKREKQVSDLIYRARKSLKTKLEKEGVTGA